MEEIKKTGTLSRIIYKNDNGFMIGSFTDFTAVGSMINPELSMNYTLTGQFEENPTHGKQFKFSSYETVLPSDESGIFKYIVKSCKFVGWKTGNKIIEAYGENTLEILRTDPARVSSEISGITQDRAKEIMGKLLENEKLEKVLVELETLLAVPGMRKNLPTELVKKYKSNAAEVVKDNPYILIIFRGISFFMADSVALKLGINPSSINRRKAAIWHVLTEIMQEGSIWISEQDLIFKTRSLIQIDGVLEAAQDLIKNHKIVEKNGYYAKSIPAFEEQKIAEKIMVLLRN